MRLSVVVSLVAGVALAVLTARPASAQKACDLLLPPSGGSFEIAIHPAYLTSIQFPEKLGSAKTSDLSEYEIRPDGDRGLLIRPKLAKAGAANINLTTGAVRLSVNLRTVDEPKDACAIVTFKATTEEDARQKAIDDAVAARTAALSAELAALKAEQAKQVRAQLDATIAARSIARLDVVRLKAVERNGAGIVAWVLRAVYLGDDVIVNLEIENRSGAAFQVAAVELQVDGKDRATAVRFAKDATTVAAGAKLRAAVFVPAAATLKGASLVVRGTSGDAVTVGSLGLR
jgi:hypothetical protein